MVVASLIELLILLLFISYITAVPHLLKYPFPSAPLNECVWSHCFKLIAKYNDAFHFSKILCELPFYWRNSNMFFQKVLHIFTPIQIPFFIFF